jgi:YjjG family noncanonical pyrimidine nucleotidase
MKYDLFLIDLDDTLLDFRASERRSFQMTMEQFGVPHETTYETYQRENNALWSQFERGEVTKEHLRVERFRRMSDAHALALDVHAVSDAYLDVLPSTVVLNYHAVELCQWLSERGEIGILTNGIQAVQSRRIANSGIAPYISFTCVSDACGYAKPDVRFFEHSSTMAKKFDKASTLMLGDRLEADILGAMNFGIDSCWFNPHKQMRGEHHKPTYEIDCLSQLRPLLT